MQICMHPTSVPNTRGKEEEKPIHQEYRKREARKELIHAEVKAFHRGCQSISTIAINTYNGQRERERKEEPPSMNRPRLVPFKPTQGGINAML